MQQLYTLLIFYSDEAKYYIIQLALNYELLLMFTFLFIEYVLVDLLSLSSRSYASSVNPADGYMIRGLLASPHKLDLQDVNKTYLLPDITIHCKRNIYLCL